MNNYWIKIYSEFLSWEWYKETNTKALFIHCLLKANWKDGKFQGEVIPRGSFATSLESLSKELGLTIQQTRTSLKHLISTGELTNKSNNKYRIITINNYEKYQQLTSNLTSNQQTTNKQPNKQLTTIEDISMYICSSLERIYARAIVGPEFELIQIWSKSYELELIEYAINISAMNNRKNVKYVNGILKNWKNAGYKTKQDVLDNEQRIEELKNKEPEELFDYNWLEED